MLREGPRQAAPVESRGEAHRPTRTMRKTGLAALSIAAIDALKDPRTLTSTDPRGARTVNMTYFDQDGAIPALPSMPAAEPTPASKHVRPAASLASAATSTAEAGNLTSISRSRWTRGRRSPSPATTPTSAGTPGALRAAQPARSRLQRGRRHAGHRLDSYNRDSIVGAHLAVQRRATCVGGLRRASGTLGNLTLPGQRRNGCNTRPRDGVPQCL